MTFNKVLELINPVENIESIEQLKTALLNENAYTLCERKSMISAYNALADIKENNISGAIFEIGVWRGGFAAALQYTNTFLGLNRHLYLCDTFNGFVKDQIQNEKDLKALKLFEEIPAINYSEDTVLSLLNKLSLGNDNITILKGDLNITLRNISIPPISFLHIDVDFYEPTYNSLAILFDKVVSGGYIYIDDYNVKSFSCKDAVDTFRKKNNIKSEIISCGKYAVYFKK
jgi:O-methyltransferase